MTIETVRRLMHDHPRTTDGYPPEVRDAVARYASAQRRAGTRWCILEAEVGVSSASMRNWIEGLAPGGFQEVVVGDAPPHTSNASPAALTITSPTGFVLAGCDLEQAIAVLRSLR